MLGRALDHLVSVATIVIACVAVWIAFDRYSGDASDASAAAVARPASSRSIPALYKPGEQVAALPSVDYTMAPATLLMVVKSDCGYCDASMPFYKRIVERRNRERSKVRLIVGAPSTDAGFDGYLGANGLTVDQTLTLQQGSLKIRATPTLLVIDNTGRLKKVWEGQLAETEEQAVMQALFGAS